MRDSIDHRPDGRWEFDKAVTDCFDDMLERSIPLYKEMRKAVDSLAEGFARKHTDIVDIGASRGEASSNLIAQDRRLVLVEVSPPMLSVLKKRYEEEERLGTVKVIDQDLRSGYPGVRASVTLAVLTLQFVPIEHRQRVLRRAFESTIPGGCIIVVEKILGATSELDDVFVDAYLGLKFKNGYGTEEIQRKRLSLEGILVPVYGETNERFIRAAGFQEVDCFWRWMNFAGWIGVKR